MTTSNDPPPNDPAPADERPPQPDPATAASIDAKTARDISDADDTPG